MSIKQQKNKTHEYHIFLCRVTDESIGDFSTKPVGWAKFHYFGTIITNINHNEYRPVDMNELMTLYNEHIIKRFHMVPAGSFPGSHRKDDLTVSKEHMHMTSADMSSQEGVKDMYTILNIMLASIRGAHKVSNKNTPINSGHAHRHTYAELATPSSE